MTRLEFSEMYPYAVDGSRRSAIFGEKKALLVKILQQGSPVYQDTFSIYAGGDHVVLKVYQSSNDGKLRRYDFPMNAIVDYVNMEINKYGSD